MAKFRLQNEPGFEGRFSVVVEGGNAVTPDEQSFQERIAYLTEQLAAVQDRGGAFDRLRLAARSSVVERLRSTADDFCAGRLSADLAILTSYIIQGQWDVRLELTEQLPFAVQELDATREPVRAHTLTLAHDIQIQVADLPIPVEKLRFKVDVDRTLTVIKVVLPTYDAGEEPDIRAKPKSPGAPNSLVLASSIAGGRIERMRARLRRAGDSNRALRLNRSVERRRASYIRQLAGIARVGLQGVDPAMVTLASQSLDALREEFVSMEAGAVKNRYLWRLGWRCLLAAALSVLAYCLIRNAGKETYSVLYAFRNFFLLTAGTAVGIWLSFSLRRVILSFLDLAALEEDRLDPTIRVLFVVGLASVAGLLFWNGAVSVGIGDFQSNIAAHGAWAVLIGLLLGISERAMATAVSKRATDFTGAIGGK